MNLADVKIDSYYAALIKDKWTAVQVIDTDGEGFTVRPVGEQRNLIGSLGASELKVLPRSLSVGHRTKY